MAHEVDQQYLDNVHHLLDFMLKLRQTLRQA
jgi:hypothetical protein